MIKVEELRLTLGETGTQDTRNLLDEGIRGEESIVLAGQLLDELLVLVELLQVVGGHGIDTKVLGTVDIVLVTENAAPVSILLSAMFSLDIRTRCSCQGEGRKGA